MHGPAPPRGSALLQFVDEGDGATARGVWISPGLETLSVTPGAGEEGNWAWRKYGADFSAADRF